MKNIWNKLNKKAIAAVAVIGILVVGLLILPSVINMAKTLLGIPHFERVADMHYARSGHNAVLLQDGRVLIDGVEIYEPKKRNFKLIDKQYRTGGQTMTVLNNGLVLIIRAYKNSVLFDPKTETSSPTDSLKYPRKDFTATLLQDGRVLVVGGELIPLESDINHQGRHLAEYSEIYDPKTGKFEVGPKINVPRFEHGAILLDDGNVLVVGGGNNKERVMTAELYDATANKFIKINDIKEGILVPYLVKLKNRNVLILRGDFNFELYDSKNKEFKIFMPDKKVERLYEPVLLEDGNIFLTAGSKKKRWYVVGSKNTDILNPYTKKLTQGPNLHKKRGGHTATLLKDGTVLITGGETPQKIKNFKSAELYIPNNK